MLQWNKFWGEGFYEIKEKTKTTNLRDSFFALIEGGTNEEE